MSNSCLWFRFCDLTSIHTLIQQAPTAHPTERTIAAAEVVTFHSLGRPVEDCLDVLIRLRLRSWGSGVFFRGSGVEGIEHKECVPKQGGFPGVATRWVLETGKETRKYPTRARELGSLPKMHYMEHVRCKMLQECSVSTY